jgi:hypothetical protein
MSWYDFFFWGTNYITGNHFYSHLIMLIWKLCFCTT